MDQIRTMTRFTGVDQDGVEDFRRLAAEGVERVADEPGTLGYDWFESADGTVFVAHELFADSDAVLAHAANVGDLVGQWVDLADGVSVEIFGVPSEELRSALAAMAPSIFSPLGA
jgi:quinol monooxygenase YgiN